MEPQKKYTMGVDAANENHSVFSICVVGPDKTIAFESTSRNKEIFQEQVEWAAEYFKIPIQNIFKEF